MLRHAWLLRAAAVTRAAVQSRWRSSSGISGTGAKATKLPPVQLTADEQRVREALAAAAARAESMMAQASSSSSSLSSSSSAVSVSVDVSGLRLPRTSAVPVERGVDSVTPMEAHLRALIGVLGPLSVARYMRECLTHPELGYYTTHGHSAIGVDGGTSDFVTSPELSQVFGECIALWAYEVWQRLGSPPRLLLVEMGPGRGTLMLDLLRAARRLPRFYRALEVWLVEVSPQLRQDQARALGVVYSPPSSPSPPSPSDSVSASLAERVAAVVGTGQRVHRMERAGVSDGEAGEGESASEGAMEGAAEASAVTADGVRVAWCSSLSAVPRSASMALVAHEFLDALPVHQLVATRHGWRERLIDLASAEDEAAHVASSGGLRIALARAATLASDRLSALHYGSAEAAMAAAQAAAGAAQEGASAESAAVLEVSVEAQAVVQAIAQRVAGQGGAALLVDYGGEGGHWHSLRAIAHHRFVPVLERPGETDLSCLVDFAALAAVATKTSSAVAVSAVQTQHELLEALGVEARAVQLLQQCHDEPRAERFTSALARLLDRRDMGHSYKALVLAAPATKMTDSASQRLPGCWR